MSGPALIQTYRYARPSVFVERGSQRLLALASSLPEEVSSPTFFEGRLTTCCSSREVAEEGQRKVRLLALLCMLSLSCRATSTGAFVHERPDDIAGTLADIHTVPGTFPGYSIRRDCPPSVVVVLGIPGDVSAEAPPPGGGLGHVTSTGIGGTCDHRAGEMWFVDDYGAVDALVPTMVNAVWGTDRSVAIVMSGRTMDY